MTGRSKLPASDVREALNGLPGWTYGEDRITKEYTFRDFKDAVAFIVRLSFEADSMDHHPRLENVYNRVTVSLTTHDAGNAVTEMDIKLAKAIESVMTSTYSEHTKSQ